MSSKQLWQVKEIESVFQADRFDLSDYGRALTAYPRLASVNAGGKNEFCGQPAQDAFFDLYKAAPRFQDPVSPGLAPLKTLIEKAHETLEYKQLRGNSVGDILSAAVGADAFVSQVMASLPKEVKDKARQAERRNLAAAVAQNEAAEANSLGDFLSELAQTSAEAGNSDRAEALQAQAAEAYERGMQAQTKAAGLAEVAALAAAEAGQVMAAHDAQIKAALNYAAGQAAAEAKETSTLVKSFGLAAGTKDGYIDPESARAIMAMMRGNKNLQELADLIGWAQTTVRAEWRKSAHGNTELTGYRQQVLNPGRMATGEFARMVSSAEAIRQDWQRRAADNNISHRKYSGEKPQTRGDFAIVRDSSGSMEGRENATAVALEWALLEIARRDKRGFVSIPFSGSGQYHAWRAPEDGKGDVRGLLDHLGTFYGGGTEPYAPMTKAIDEVAHGDLKADIMLLTDGEFSNPPAAFLDRLTEARKQTPLKIVTVVIGGYGQGHVAEKFSDRVVYVKDLFDDRTKLRDAIKEVV